MLTDGAYVRADNRSLGLQEIISSINETQKAKLSTTIFEEYDERYQYPLGIALVILLIEFLILPRRNRLLKQYNIFARRESESD